MQILSPVTTLALGVGHHLDDIVDAADVRPTCGSAVMPCTATVPAPMTAANLYSLIHPPLPARTACAERNVGSARSRALGQAAAVA